MTRAAVTMRHLRAGIYQVCSDAVGPSCDVSWAYGQQPQDAMPDCYASLSIVNGPSPLNQSRARGVLVEPPASVTIDIAAPSDGALAAVRLAPYDYRHDCTAVDTQATVAASLATLIETYETGITATPGATSLTLTATDPGALDRLSLEGIASSAPTTPGTSLWRTATVSSWQIELQVYARRTPIDTDAQALVTAAHTYLQTIDAYDALSRHGIGIIDRGIPSNITALAGPLYESRAVLRFRVTTTAMMYTDADEITTITHDETINT